MTIRQIFLLLAAAWASAAPCPAGTFYYVNPADGNDFHSGLQPGQAWRTFKPVNTRLLTPGDHVEILAPGSFQETLMPVGAGTAASPVEIHFARGRYDFFPTNALKLKLEISNDNDDPDTPKAVALYFKETKHIHITGDHADIYIHGKMIEAMLDHAADITFTALNFDYSRPTVSELTVLNVAADHADVRIHRDSTYEIENGRLVWIGEGWRSDGLDLSQQYDPAIGRVWRCRSPLAGVTKAEDLAPFQVRLFFNRNPGLTEGRVFQFRETLRDGAGVFILRSQDVTWRDCAFRFMHGLGVVSQFSESLTFDHVTLAPRPDSDRTCAGWADLLHFSGCRGSIKVEDCEMSGTSDDPINVHGTYLRVVGRPASNQLLLRFMHPQSYGFEAFTPDDQIELVSHTTLRSYHSNRVASAEARGDKEILLTLQQSAPENIARDDVVENVTWTPSVEVRRCKVSLDSCRGFLVTTRQPVLIEDNTFLKTAMSAILIADDANSWFESGPVRDVTIRGNRFLQCGEPVIAIAPENHPATPEEPVHQNIRILNNYFDLSGHIAVAARSVENLVIQGNRFSGEQLPVQTTSCTGLKIADNEIGVLESPAEPKPAAREGGP